MSDDDLDDKPKSFGLMSPLGIAGLVAIAIPLTFSMASSSSSTINGVVVEANYFDPVAVFAGGVGILLGLLLGAIGKGPRLGRWIAALIIMAIGGRHVAHGLGIDYMPGAKQRTPSGAPFAQLPSGPSCDADNPETCPALCDKGEADACDELGVAYAKGDTSLGRDDAKAETLFIKACELKDKQGCTNGAVFYFEGKTKVIDGPRAVEMGKAGCALKSGRACNFAGVILADGKGVEGDKAGAFALFQQACEQKHYEGCENLARSYRDGAGVEASLEKAIETYELACDNGMGDSCSDLANILSDEDRSKEDRARMMPLYEKSCALKSPFGCSNLGHFLLKTDPPRAVDPLDDACTGGRGRACEDLGLLLYAGGEGVEKNPVEARRVFARGCENGHMNSCANEGIMLSLGEGGPVDLDEAAEYLKEACDAKHEKACGRLGVVLASSDPDAAKPLLTTACKVSKFTDACDALKKLGKGGKKPGKKK